MYSLSLKARLALAAALLGAGALVTAMILWFGMGETADRLDRALAAEARMGAYAALSGQTASFLVIATEVAQAAAPLDARKARLGPASEQMRRTFQRLHAGLDEAAREAEAEGVDARARLGAQSLTLARMEALLDNVLDALTSGAAGPEALRAHVDIFATGFDPLLSEAVNTELVYRNTVLQGVERLRGALRTAALVIAAVSVLAVAAFHFALIRPQFRRLDDLRAAARRIAAEDFAVSLPVDRPDEIGQLYGETNRMAEALSARREEIGAEWERLNETIAERTEALRAANAALAEADENRRRFFTDVSHELRTPLTVIMMEAELGAAGGDDPRAAFDTIRNRAARLTRRVEDLLRVARSESGRISLDIAPVELHALMKDVAEEVAAEIAGAGMTLAAPQPPGATMAVDANWIRQVAVSLTRNAIRHAREGGVIALEAAAQADCVMISVTDAGPGVAPADQARVFDRFAQGGGAAAGQGFGVGLALARWVVEEHGGEITLESPVPRETALGPAPGARVALRLPRAPG